MANQSKPFIKVEYGCAMTISRSVNWKEDESNKLIRPVHKSL
jgi:hypothetical protein